MGYHYGVVSRILYSVMLKMTINNLLYACVYEGFVGREWSTDLPAASVAKPEKRNRPHDIFTLTEY